MKKFLSIALLGVFVLAGCEMTAMKDDKSMAQKSLYDRLGGKPAITAVVDEFVARLAADNRVNKRFAKTDMPKLKAHLVDQVCEATGGPCKYAGKTMRDTHKGMNITNDEFNWTGEHLAAALDKFRVPATEKNELLKAIGSMQKDIVGL
ncbi:MAG: group 1 truncated hemoglobin [Alphaproteobacteria bacterium]|nr:group 1 truncated hemoglobin [Alphaproteobacteria bacterium]